MLTVFSLCSVASAAWCQGPVHSVDGPGGVAIADWGRDCKAEGLVKVGCWAIDGLNVCPLSGGAAWKGSHPFACLIQFPLERLHP
jgi:hypothetical protein